MLVKWQMGSSSCLFGFHQQKMLLRQAELFTLFEQCGPTFKTFSILNNGHVRIKSSFNSSRSIRLKTSKASQIGNQPFVQRKTFALGPRAIKICKWSIHGFGLEIGTLPLTTQKCSHKQHQAQGHKKGLEVWYHWRGIKDVFKTDQDGWLPSSTNKMER